MIKNNEFSKAGRCKNNVITDIPLAESAGKLKYVDPQSDIVKKRSLSESVSETDRTCHIKRYTGNGVRRSFCGEKGQDHIVKTLQNQIGSGRIGHAYPVLRNPWNR